MANSLLLINTSVGHPKNFLQSPSFHLNDSTSDDLNLCELNEASHFVTNKLNSKLTINTHASVSHIGLSLHEFDSLSSAVPLSTNVWGGGRLRSFLEAAHSSKHFSDAEPSTSDCSSESSNEAVRSEFVYSKVCEPSQRECKTCESVKAGSAITPYDLVALINNQESLLLLDCRSFMAFNSNHINGALNVSCSDRITKKRLTDGKVKVVDIVSGLEGKEIYRRLEDHAEIILYDESTVETSCLPETNPLNLLSKCLMKHGKHSKFLQGGLQAFQDSYSFMCSQPDAAAGVPLLFSPTSPEINCQIDTAVASEILPYLFIGNQRDAANKERLNKLGITHVLNVTSHLPLHFEDEGITYKRLPATDSGSQNLKQYFSEAINFIECAHKTNGKVLVHCQAGVSRSPAIVTAYLIATTCKSLTEAFTIVKDRRPIVAPNINFMGQLLEFEQQSVSSSGLCPLSDPLRLL